MPTKSSRSNFLCATALATSLLARMAVPTFAQQTVDYPDREHQEMLCTAVAMGNLKLVEKTIADFDAKGLLSQPSVIPAYPNIRCGEAGLTLLMVSISGGGADQKRTMAYLFRGLFEYDEIRLNEANYAGETELDVIASLSDIVSPRFVKKMRKLGAKTACELSGECEYTGPDDWSRFTK